MVWLIEMIQKVIHMEHRMYLNARIFCQCLWKVSNLENVPLQSFSTLLPPLLLQNTWYLRQVRGLEGLLLVKEKHEKIRFYRSIVKNSMAFLRISGKLVFRNFTGMMRKYSGLV